MADAAELEGHLLEFRLKTFGFERSVTVGGIEYAVFARTETESESQFRPKLVRLRVALPSEWVIYDMMGDALRVSPGGALPGPRPEGSALEEAAEKSEFVEQGVEWRKRVVEKGSIVYVPGRDAERLLSPAGIAALTGQG